VGPAAPAADPAGLQRSLFGVFDYSSRALTLVWTTNKPLSIALALLTLVAGVLPAAVAYIGAQIVDAVIHAADLHARVGTTAFSHVFKYVGLEGLLIADNGSTS
jgi:ATP-binding cassette, subfamily B, bacterial